MSILFHSSAGSFQCGNVWLIFIIFFVKKISYLIQKVKASIKRLNFVFIFTKIYFKGRFTLVNFFVRMFIAILCDKHKNNV